LEVGEIGPGRRVQVAGLGPRNRRDHYGQTNLRLRGRTLDLSLVGCYVEMKHTLPVRTETRVQIIHNDAIFSALGAITACEPNAGTRIRFTDVQLDQHEILQGWLAALAPERL
jgi:hypothetical protein